MCRSLCAAQVKSKVGTCSLDGLSKLDKYLGTFAGTGGLCGQIQAAVQVRRMRVHITPAPAASICRQMCPCVLYCVALAAVANVT